MNYQSYHQEYELRLRLICLPTEKGTLRVEKRSLHAKCLLCGRLSATLPSSSFTTDVRHRRQRLNGFGNETDPTLLASVNMLEISCTLAKLQSFQHTTDHRFLSERTRHDMPWRHNVLRYLLMHWLPLCCCLGTQQLHLLALLLGAEGSESPETDAGCLYYTFHKKWSSNYIKITMYYLIIQLYIITSQVCKNTQAKPVSISYNPTSSVQRTNNRNDKFWARALQLLPGASRDRDGCPSGTWKASHHLLNFRLFWSFFGTFWIDW